MFHRIFSTFALKTAAFWQFEVALLADCNACDSTENIASYRVYSMRLLWENGDMDDVHLNIIIIINLTQSTHNIKVRYKIKRKNSL